LILDPDDLDGDPAEALWRMYPVEEQIGHSG